MLLLYFYCILGFTDLNIITKYKNKSNSNINIKDYSYNIFYIYPGKTFYDVFSVSYI